MRTLLTPGQMDNLVLRYSEPHRQYHTMSHITTMFQLAAGHGVRLSIAQQLAIWFHDAIYDAGIDNEACSANLMESTCSSNSWISPGVIDRAKAIILDTRYHKTDNHESMTVLDLDLAGLGFDWETYRSVGTKIRKEYEHLNDGTFYTNRIAFIKGLLNRSNIFYTPWGRDFYEQKARKNLETELKLLAIYER